MLYTEHYSNSLHTTSSDCVTWATHWYAQDQVCSLLYCDPYEAQPLETTNLQVCIVLYNT